MNIFLEIIKRQEILKIAHKDLHISAISILNYVNFRRIPKAKKNIKRIETYLQTRANSESSQISEKARFSKATISYRISPVARTNDVRFPSALHGHIFHTFPSQTHTGRNYSHVSETV